MQKVVRAPTWVNVVNGCSMALMAVLGVFFLVLSAGVVHGGGAVALIVAGVVFVAAGAVLGPRAFRSSVTLRAGSMTIRGWFRTLTIERAKLVAVHDTGEVEWRGGKPYPSVANLWFFGSATPPDLRYRVNRWNHYRTVCLREIQEWSGKRQP